MIRAALTMIAADEAKHAGVGWSTLAWCVDDPAARAAVAARVERPSTEVSAPLPDSRVFSPSQLAADGLFDQETLGASAERRIALVKARALALLQNVNPIATSTRPCCSPPASASVG